MNHEHRSSKWSTVYTCTQSSSGLQSHAGARFIYRSRILKHASRPGQCSRESRWLCCALLDRSRTQKASQAKESLGGRRVIGEDDDARAPCWDPRTRWVKCLFDPMLKRSMHGMGAMAMGIAACVVRAPSISGVIFDRDTTRTARTYVRACLQRTLFVPSNPT